METREYRSVRVSLTLVVTLLLWTLLLWQHFHGGVASHNILARADLPAVSNWWGALLLPALTWILLGLILGRISGHETTSFQAVRAFTCAGAFGVLLAASYVTGHGGITPYFVRSLPLIALAFPIYRAEYVLGFVIGMTYFFGALLPTGFAVAVTAVAWGVYRYIRPGLLRIVRWGRRESAALSRP